MSKVLLVTGGSRGIGYQTSVLAAEAGWDVCVNYVSNDARAQETVKAIEKQGRKALAVKGDITKAKDVEKLFETCDKDLGRITGFVNSAGVVEPYGRLDEMSFDDIRWHMDINVMGTVMTAQHAVKRMSTKHGGEGGAMVFLSSVTSRLGGPGFCVPYAASKGAVDSFAWGLAQELAGEGVRVNAVSPGVIDTEIQPPGRVEEMGPKLPMGRVGRPEEVARTVLWLLSEEASYVSGANVPVSGAR